MATSAPTPLRQVLEERVRQLVLDTESLFAEARDRARREMADQLNQAVRRIRQSADLEDVGATLVDATACFSQSAALFGISGDLLNGERIRGVSEAAAAAFASLEVGMASAPALRNAIESRDQVVTLATPGQVSEEIVKLLEHNPDSRASIYPVVVADRTVALLYVWGNPQGAAVELLVQTASLVWAARVEPPVVETPVVETPEPAPAPALIAIAGVVEPPKPVAPPARQAKSWDELPPEEQRIHLRAQRFARVQVSEMRLFEPDAVQSGRTYRNLYDALRERIDRARGTYRSNFFAPCPSMVDYLHLELVRTLANDNPELLGGEYPGPLV